MLHHPLPVYVVIGGGIAGVSCAQALESLSPNQNARVLLLSSSSIVKSVTNLDYITRSLTEFEVREQNLQELQESLPGIETRCCNVTKIIPEENLVATDDGQTISYTKLCVCTGAKPSIIDDDCPYVIGIRDTNTVTEMENRLQNAKKVVIVGNGGIALELVYGLKKVDVIWIIKDKSIGATFFDSGAAEFLVSEVNKPKDDEDALKPDPRRAKYTVFNLKANSSSIVDVFAGSALGPDWHENAHLSGAGSKAVTIEYNAKVENLEYDTRLSSQQAFPLKVTLDNGKIINCDFLISATGVTPNCDLFSDMVGCEIDNAGGVHVDSNMRVCGISDVYAAGDVCHCSWDKSPHWQQMRLWSQARQMGIFAAQCMVKNLEDDDDVPLDFCFEVFAHSTRFFGYKVVLLGKFNCQDLDPDKCELVVRVTPSKEYVKVVLYEGRLFGAVLVGETDLEETFENLILNGLDLSHFGENLLHPDVELEDYFD